MHSRDLDSLITEREAAAVLEWQQPEYDNRPVHIMRDHPSHGVPILGGMWGVDLGRMDARKRMRGFWRRSLYGVWGWVSIMSKRPNTFIWPRVVSHLWQKVSYRDPGL